MSGEAEILLEAIDLCVSIGGVDICHDLSLRVAAGNCLGILGPNGTGKTTLLHTLAGLRVPDSGEIRCAGADIETSSRRQLAQSMGVLFQAEDRGFPGSVFETVLSGRHPHLGYWGWETADDLAIARAALKTVGLQRMEQRALSSLSGGEHRRMEIATLLAQQPRIALLDEPTNHLDLGNQISILEMLKTRFTCNGQAMILVLHDINHALRYCDSLLLLQGNGLWTSGTTHQVARVETLSELYGHPLVMIEGPAGPVMLPA